jgi:hypothetical protein
MARGGDRPGAGRPKTGATFPRDVVKNARALGIASLEYMLRVMRDPKVDCGGSVLPPRVSDRRIGRRAADAEAAKTAGSSNPCARHDRRSPAVGVGPRVIDGGLLRRSWLLLRRRDDHAPKVL